MTAQQGVEKNSTNKQHSFQHKVINMFAETQIPAFIQEILILELFFLTLNPA
jgi:hypothetical protein